MKNEQAREAKAQPKLTKKNRPKLIKGAEIECNNGRSLNVCVFKYMKFILEEKR